ncbi:MAG: hypothetical protein EON96_09855 [Caulobacteraceae bacterium]|nr:MAG: hypothetical protein EON96_09855 [Caulobacteraceae bacterium]
MGITEYFLGLTAIVSGLALTDMVSSLHGLLRRFRLVRWDFLPLTVAGVVLFGILYGWFVGFMSDWQAMPFWMFANAVAAMIALFLAAKAVLPDDDGSRDEVDLLAHYRSSNRYVWLSLAALNALYMINSAAYASFRGRLDWTLGDSVEQMIFVALCLTLAGVQKMWLHRIVAPALLIVLMAMNGGRMLTGTV